MKKIKHSFYTRKNVLIISQELLGKILCTNINGQLTSGIITDVEAYNGIHDKASHAYNNRKTTRTQVMYEEGGISYVYVCYGIHYLFNIITNKKNNPDAILVRGIKPISGINTILRRRKKNKIDPPDEGF